MNNSPICRPDDPAPKLDFWQWRQNRRHVIDLILAIANTSTVSFNEKKQLRTWAEHLEMEALSPKELGLLKSFASPTSPDRLNTNTDLMNALLDRLPPGSIIGGHAEYWLSVTPDWAAIDSAPPSRIIFSGRMGPTYLHAALTPTQNLIPEYQVTWLEDPSDSLDSGDTLPLLNAMVGLNLDEGALTWDWLFTRRLTWLCQEAFLPWPKDPDALILESSSFKPLSRAV